MLRGTFRPDALAGERFFRWRGGNVSRLEGLADAVFALTLTLLVVRLAVPASFAEVRYALFRAPVYLACFALFLWIWYCHHQFHRRYGLEDPLTVALDGAILFVVLLFALPLRFVAELLYSGIRFRDPGLPLQRGFDEAPLPGSAGESLTMIAPGEGALLMTFYTGGFTLLFLLFALQTANAGRRWRALELDELERAVTRGTIRAHGASALIGGGALALSLLPTVAGHWAGIAFFLMGPVHGLLGWSQGRALERAHTRSLIQAPVGEAQRETS